MSGGECERKKNRKTDSSLAHNRTNTQRLQTHRARVSDGKKPSLSSYSTTSVVIVSFL